jgi:hypothetical protein
MGTCETAGRRVTGFHWAVLGINLGIVAIFGVRFLVRLNYEFLIYIGVILACIGLIGSSLLRIRYTPATLVSLTFWSLLHLAGGGIVVGDGRLYDVILVPLSARVPVLRYDQVVHVWGFAAATLAMYCLLEGSLRDLRPRLSLAIVLVMAGLGAGALNEIVEFLVVAVVPEAGVGGYLNTSLDLCADLIGALLALGYIRLRYWRGGAA